MLAGSFNDGAPMLIQQFDQQFVQGAYPSGTVERGTVLEYLQLAPMQNFYVPILVFIDRKGIIRAQYIGDSDFLKDQEKNIRALAEKLLQEPVAATSRSTVRTSRKKS